MNRKKTYQEISHSNTSISDSPIFKFFRMDTIWIYDCTIPFLYTNTFRPSSMKVSHCMQSYITKTLQKLSTNLILTRIIEFYISLWGKKQINHLNYETFAFETSCKSDFWHIFFIVNEDLKSLPYTTSSCRCTSMNTWYNK